MAGDEHVNVLSITERDEVALRGCKRLLREFYEELGAMGVDLDSFQPFFVEVDSMPYKYVVDKGGKLFVAVLGKGIETPEDVVGLIAFKHLEDGVCEMKRTFVTKDHRGKGIGKLLIQKCVQEAKDIKKEDGTKLYQRMVLDTLERLESALKSYEKIGFSRIPPYYDNPTPDTVFLEMKF